MKHFFLILFPWGIFISFFSVSNAHPLDISSTLLTLHGDRAAVSSYFHPFEAEYLIRKKEGTFSDASDFLKYNTLFESYIYENIGFVAQGNPCTIVEATLAKKELYLILSEGIQVDYSILCPRIISDLQVDVRFFTGFQLQTNRITFFDADGAELLFKVGTPVIHTISYTSSGVGDIVDTDHDGLSDEEERAYRTRVDLADTDSDFYTDTEEVLHGWDPLNPSVSPGQIVRDGPVSQMLTPDASISQTSHQTEKTQIPTQKGIGGISSGAWGESYFQMLMEHISTSSKQSATPYTLAGLSILAMILGFLHALGPGHAKMILTGIVAESKVTYWQAVRFAIVFSVTHIVDILILFLVMYILSDIFDMQKVLTYLQYISPLLLCILAIYLTYDAIRMIFFTTVNHKESSTLLNRSSRSIWIFGLVSGIIPCTFGWSVFFLLLSLGKLAWVPLLIGSIGFGILLCLLFILTLVYFFRIQVQSRYAHYRRYSALFSSVFLLGVSLYLLSRIVF